MDATDRQALLDLAERPEKVTDEHPYDSTSPTRMSRVALAVVKHAEEFNLDGDGENGSLPMESYISSYLADVLHLADTVRPGAAKDMLAHAISFIADSDTETYERLRGFKIQ